MAPARIKGPARRERLLDVTVIDDVVRSVMAAGRALQERHAQAAR
jgi:hypothetical protein